MIQNKNFKMEGSKIPDFFKNMFNDVEYEFMVVNSCREAYFCAYKFDKLSVVKFIVFYKKYDKNNNELYPNIFRINKSVWIYNNSINAEKKFNNIYLNGNI